MLLKLFDKADEFLTESPGCKTYFNSFIPFLIPMFHKGKFNSCITHLLSLMEGYISDDNCQLIKSAGKDLTALAKTFEDSGKYQQAFDAYGSICFLFKKIKYWEGVTDSMHRGGRLYEISGDYESSKEMYLDALSYTEKPCIEKVQTLVQLALLLWRTDDKEGAGKYIEEAKQMFFTLESSDTMETKKQQFLYDFFKAEGRKLIDIAKSYEAYGNYENALSAYASVCFLFQEIDFHEGIAGCLRSGGILYEKLGDYENAMSMYQKSLHILEKPCRQKARTLAQIGLFLHRSGNGASAMDYTAKAMEMFHLISAFDEANQCKQQLRMIASALY